MAVACFAELLSILIGWQMLPRAGLRPRNPPHWGTRVWASKTVHKISVQSYTRYLTQDKIKGTKTAQLHFVTKGQQEALADFWQRADNFLSVVFYTVQSVCIPTS